MPGADMVGTAAKYIRYLSEFHKLLPFKILLFQLLCPLSHTDFPGCWSVNLHYT